MALNFFNPTGLVAGEEFYGREAAIAAVTTRLESGQSILILGQRRIGKTSLLRHLFGFRKPAVPGAHILHDEFLGRDSTVELLAKSLVRQLLAKGLDSPKRYRTNLLTLHHWGERLRIRGEYLAIYVNDIDDLLYGAETGADDIERLFRGLIETGHTVICATSYVPLEQRDSAHERVPLSNVLYPYTLGAFSEDEASSFLADKSQACGDELSPDEIALILSLAGLVPFYLQRVGWNLFANPSFVRSKNGQRLARIVSAIDEHYRSLESLMLSDLNHLKPSS